MHSLRNRKGIALLPGALGIASLLVLCDTSFAGVPIEAPETSAAATAREKPKPSPPSEAPETEPLRLVLELQDGSRIVGVPTIESAKLHTSFAKFDLAFKLISTMEFDEQHENVRVSLANGDSVQGTLNLDAIQLQTSFGKVSILLSQVLRVSTQQGSALRGLVLYCSFDRDEGGIVTDLSGNNNNGKVNGTKWTREGAHGGALTFAGDDYVDLGRPKANSGSFSVCAWIKTTEIPNSPYGGVRWIIARSQWMEGAWQLMTSGGRAVFQFPSNEGTADGSARIADGRWRHVAGVYDADKRAIRIFVDGQLDGSQTASGSFSENGNSLYIGLRPGESNGFKGSIDEVMIFDRALTERDVRALFDTFPKER